MESGSAKPPLRILVSIPPEAGGGGPAAAIGEVLPNTYEEGGAAELEGECEPEYVLH